jgi:hypothetical protein
MGLDMYLSASKHVHKVNWQESTAKEIAVNPKYTTLMTLVELDHVPSDIYGASVEVVCAYWRKSNAIHNWFVKNVQDGKDDCGTYYVSAENLKTLRHLCHRVIDEKNPSLLMPTEGFFFGSTDINEYYWADIEETITKLDRVLNLPDIDDLSFSYHSSW